MSRCNVFSPFAHPNLAYPGADRFQRLPVVGLPSTLHLVELKARLAPCRPGKRPQLFERVAEKLDRLHPGGIYKILYTDATWARCDTSWAWSELRPPLPPPWFSLPRRRFTRRRKRCAWLAGSPWRQKRARVRGFSRSSYESSAGSRARTCGSRSGVLRTTRAAWPRWQRSWSA